MKKSYTNRCLGRTVTIKDVPADFNEVAKVLGSEEKAWEALIAKLVYQSWNPIFREAVAARLEQETKIPRPQAIGPDGVPVTKQVKNENGDLVEEPVPCSEKFYISLLEANEDLSLTDEYLDQVFQEVADTIPFDARPKVRSAAPTKQDFAEAKGFMDAIEAGTFTPEHFIERFNALNAPITFKIACGDEVNVDSLAKMLKINRERKARESNSDFIS